VDAHYTEDVHDPAAIHANGEEVSDLTYKAMAIAASDPATHVRRIKAMQQLGATAIVLMNVSGADPHGALRVYRDDVLPKLRAS
jgi:coenzyme F420-dependent glucose-6-phosphate dehydrogenase